MKTVLNDPNRLTAILDWLKQHKAHEEVGLLNIPVLLREDIIEMVGDLREFKKELDRNQIPKSFLYQRILLNREFAFQLEEKFWWEQFHLVQARKMYFNDIRYKDFDPMESTDFQVREKVKALDMLEYLQELQNHLDKKMKDSGIMMNHLTYLFGN